MNGNNKNKNKNKTSRLVGDDYAEFIYNSFEDERYLCPFKNYGFNLSFAKLFQDKYIFCVRCIFPIKNIVEKKELIPGIPSYIKKKRTDIYEHSYSDYFIWSWRNNFEISYFFVGEIRNLKIIPDKNIKPYAFTEQYYFLNYIKGDDEEKTFIPFNVRMEDFRLYRQSGKIFMFDSHINVISSVILKNNEIKIYKLAGDICNLTFFDSNKCEKYNRTTYKKIFEKNWSLYKVDFDKNKKSKKFYFLHDFGKTGIEGVNYNSETEKCEKKILVPYKENLFKETDVYRFSVGTTCTFINSENKSGYLGIGHLKIKYSENPNELKNENKYFNSIYQFINKNFYDLFKEKYIQHKYNQYYFFFFFYDERNSKMYLSNFFLPKIKSNSYYFSLVYPMSIIKSGNNILYSLGYGDYNSILSEKSVPDVLKTLQYDISELQDLKKFKLELF